MTEKQLQVLGEVRSLLGKAWLDLYNLDKEVSGTVFQLRQQVNVVELEVMQLIEDLRKEESEDII